MEQQTGFKLGKEYHKAVSPCLFNIYAEYIILYSGLSESQAGIRLPEKHQQPQKCGWYHLNGRKRRRTKEPLDESEREEWKSWLKAQHSKKKKKATGYITSWQIEGGNWKQWQILFSCAPKSLWKVTATMKLEDTCSLEGKPW